MKQKQLQFDPQVVLNKPLMIDLATTCEEGPRSSPLWFLYEDNKIWLFGIRNDSFIKRLQDDPRLDVMVAIKTQSIVAKDVSFFKTGPNLASKM